MKKIGDMDNLEIVKCITNDSGIGKAFHMHIDKLISSIAITLSLVNWNEVSLITGSVLAIVMTIYYIVSTVKKIRGGNKK